MLVWGASKPYFSILFKVCQFSQIFSNFLKFSQIFSNFFSQKFSKMILSAERSSQIFSNFLKIHHISISPPIFLKFSQIFSNFLNFFSQKFSKMILSAERSTFEKILKFSNSQIFSNFLKFSQKSSFYLKILHSFVFFSSGVEWLRQVYNFLNSSRVSLSTCWAGIMWLWCLSPG